MKNAFVKAVNATIMAACAVFMVSCDTVYSDAIQPSDLKVNMEEAHDINKAKNPVEDNVTVNFFENGKRVCSDFDLLKGIHRLEYRGPQEIYLEDLVIGQPKTSEANVAKSTFTGITNKTVNDSTYTQSYDYSDMFVLDVTRSHQGRTFQSDCPDVDPATKKLNRYIKTGYVKHSAPVFTPMNKIGEKTVNKVIYVGYKVRASVDFTYTRGEGYKGEMYDVTDYVDLTVYYLKGNEPEDPTWNWENGDKGLTWIDWTTDNSWINRFKKWNNGTETDNTKFSVDIYNTQTIAAKQIKYVSAFKTSYSASSSVSSASFVSTRQASSNISVAKYSRVFSVICEGVTFANGDTYEIPTLTHDGSTIEMPYAVRQYNAVSTSFENLSELTENGKTYERQLVTMTFTSSFNGKTNVAAVNELELRKEKEVEEDIDIDVEATAALAGGHNFAGYDKVGYNYFVAIYDIDRKTSKGGIGIHLNGSQTPTYFYKWDELDYATIKAEYDSWKAGNAVRKIGACFSTTSTNGKTIPAFFNKPNSVIYYFSLLKGANRDNAIYSGNITEWQHVGYFSGPDCTTYVLSQDATTVTYRYSYQQTQGGSANRVEKDVRVHKML